MPGAPSTQRWTGSALTDPPPYSSDRSCAPAGTPEATFTVREMLVDEDDPTLAVMFASITLILPFMRRIRMPSPSPSPPKGERAIEPAPSHPVEEGVA